MLSAGAIATGELLRMTAPRRRGCVHRFAWPGSRPGPRAGRLRPPRRDRSCPRRPIPSSTRGPPRGSGRIHRDRAARRRSARCGRGGAQGHDPRHRFEREHHTDRADAGAADGREAKVVVVDLSATSPTISAISVDPTAPGLAELMLGEASFSQMITRDRLSRAHLVSAGRAGSDRTLLQSPRLDAGHRRLAAGL